MKVWNGRERPNLGELLVGSLSIFWPVEYDPLSRLARPLMTMPSLAICVWESKTKSNKYCEAANVAVIAALFGVRAFGNSWLPAIIVVWLTSKSTTVLYQKGS